MHQPPAEVGPDVGAPRAPEAAAEERCGLGDRVAENAVLVGVCHEGGGPFAQGDCMDGPVIGGLHELRAVPGSRIVEAQLPVCVAPHGVQLPPGDECRVGQSYRDGRHHFAVG